MNTNNTHRDRNFEASVFTRHLHSAQLNSAGMGELPLRLRLRVLAGLLLIAGWEPPSPSPLVTRRSESSSELESTLAGVREIPLRLLTLPFLAGLLMFGDWEPPSPLVTRRSESSSELELESTGTFAGASEISLRLRALPFLAGLLMFTGSVIGMDLGTSRSKSSSILVSSFVGFVSNLSLQTPHRNMPVDSS